MTNHSSTAVRVLATMSAIVAFSMPMMMGCSSGTTNTSAGDGGTSDTEMHASAECDPAGSWDVHFQWAGRTPGELTIIVGSDKTAQVPAGPGVGATTGTTVVKDGEITWTFADGSTFSGLATSSCSTIAAGTMKNTAGKLGKFTADKGGSANSGSKECTGCTADVDCGSCERCERTTCTCVSRLTCP